MQSTVAEIFVGACSMDNSNLVFRRKGPERPSPFPPPFRGPKSGIGRHKQRALEEESGTVVTQEDRFSFK